MIAHLTLILILLTLPSASAHRLDEYLQATRLAVDVDRVDLEIDLTPGASLAPQVWAWIAPNRDAYARDFLRSIVLKLDGRPLTIELVESAFPEFHEMSEGTGVIRLRAAARIPASSAGAHQLYFLNPHHPESSVYLVNALVPANPRIQLTTQRRDRAQLSLTLDYAIAPAGIPPRTLMLLTALTMAAGLSLRLVHSRLSQV